MRTRRIFAAFFVAAASGCYSSSPHSQALPKANPEEENQRTVLQAGDLVEIRVFREPDLAGTYFIDPQGDIDFPLIGKVRLRGKDPYTVGDEIRSRLADEPGHPGYLKQPQVTLLVREHNQRKVHV